MGADSQQLILILSLTPNSSKTDALELKLMNKPFFRIAGLNVSSWIVLKWEPTKSGLDGSTHDLMLKGWGESILSKLKSNTFSLPTHQI